MMQIEIEKQKHNHIEKQMNNDIEKTINLNGSAFGPCATQGQRDTRMAVLSLSKLIPLHSKGISESLTVLSVLLIF
jgi:hypothetical protein